LFDGDQPLRIGSRALGLLQVLAENAGEVVTKDKLIEAVRRGIWVDEANLRANIGALRKVLGAVRRRLIMLGGPTLAGYGRAQFDFAHYSAPGGRARTFQSAQVALIFGWRSLLFLEPVSDRGVDARQGEYH